jgi:hypothetical protein
MQLTLVDAAAGAGGDVEINVDDDDDGGSGGGGSGGGGARQRSSSSSSSSSSASAAYYDESAACDDDVDFEIKPRSVRMNVPHTNGITGASPMLTPRSILKQRSTASNDGKSSIKSMKTNKLKRGAKISAQKGGNDDNDHGGGGGGGGVDKAYERRRARLVSHLKTLTHKELVRRVVRDAQRRDAEWQQIEVLRAQQHSQLASLRAAVDGGEVKNDELDALRSALRRREADAAAAAAT